MIMSHVRGVTVMMNLHRTISNSSAPLGFKTSFSSLFCCLAATLMLWFTLSALMGSPAAGSCF